MPIKNTDQIIPKTKHAKKDMCFTETWSKNTIVIFNAKNNGANTNKYFIRIREKIYINLMKIIVTLVELHHKGSINFPIFY